MSSYQLNIVFDELGLSALAASGQSVTISKQSASGNQTAWLTFTPQMDNVITWVEQYSVYSSTTQVVSGAVIVTSSTRNALGGSSYNINNKGYFDSGVPSKNIGINTYEISNSDANLIINDVKMVTAGLVQGAVVNGESVISPICATPILYNQLGTFTPTETVMVYTSSYSDNGLVITSVAGNAQTVQFGTGSTATITYDDDTNSFTSSN